MPPICNKMCVASPELSAALKPFTSRCGAFSCSGGESMPAAELFAIENATLEECDSALQFLGQRPVSERDDDWHNMSDKALDRRRELTLA